MQVVDTISLEVAKKSTGVVLYAKQDDDNTRYYKVRFVKDGVPVDISDATSVAFRGEKPDGHSFVNTATLNSDGTVTIEVGGQVVTAPGYVECDVAAYKNTDVLSAGNFHIKVQRVPVGANQTDSTSEFSFLTQVNTAKAAADAATEAANAAAAAANAAAALITQIVGNYMYLDDEGYICADEEEES